MVVSGSEYMTISRLDSFQIMRRSGQLIHPLLCFLFQGVVFYVCLQDIIEKFRPLYLSFLSTEILLFLADISYFGT